MGLGVGLILAAVGAVLAFAVDATVSGVNIHTVGWILLIAGIVGILLSLIFWSSWAGPGGFTVLDTPSREAALEWTAKIAAACRCAQEIREFMPDPAVGN